MLARPKVKPVQIEMPSGALRRESSKSEKNKEEFQPPKKIELPTSSLSAGSGKGFTCWKIKNRGQRNPFPSMWPFSSSSSNPPSSSSPSSTATTPSATPPSSPASSLATEISQEVTHAIDKETQNGEVDTTETPLRYLAFLNRIRPIVSPASRYLAYTSDVGESFRPIVNPRAVTAAYGISIAYVSGDVIYEGWKARQLVKDKGMEGMDGTGMFLGLKVAQRAIFQATASMIFPAITIHTLVKYTALLLSRSRSTSRFLTSPTTRAWLPTSVGLATVPALPYIFDEPIEKGLDWGFGIAEESLLDEGLRKKIGVGETHGEGHDGPGKKKLPEKEL